MSSCKKKICVAGSLNVDLTIRLERFHHPGETITAKGIHTYAGGKGGNQAVAAARLTDGVMMVGMLGDDDNGRLYRQVLQNNHVNMECLESDASTPSGTAIIEVDDKGENRIAIIPGTNGLVDQAFMDRMLPKMMEYDIFLMQYEIDIKTVAYLAHILHEAGKCVILDPAPAAPTPEDLYKSVDYITPNMTELSMLTGVQVENNEQVIAAAKILLSRGVKAVIAKMGAQGCMYVDGECEIYAKGFKVNTVDTTAAGDSYNAGFAVALAEGKTIEEALRFANAVAALSTTGAGAQGSMPTHDEVDQFLLNA